LFLLPTLGGDGRGLSVNQNCVAINPLDAAKQSAAS
jgi:hypothetical protein